MGEICRQGKFGRLGRVYNSWERSLERQDIEEKQPVPGGHNDLADFPRFVLKVFTIRVLHLKLQKKYGSSRRAISRLEWPSALSWSIKPVRAAGKRKRPLGYPLPQPKAARPPSPNRCWSRRTVRAEQQNTRATSCWRAHPCSTR